MNLKLGELIVVSHYSDFDFPQDVIQLGKFEKIINGYIYIQGNNRGFKYFKRLGNCYNSTDMKNTL